MFPTVSPKTVKAHWTALFQAHADRIVEAIAPGSRIDFMRDFALPFSGECLKSITGLTNIGFADMDAWSQGMIEGIAAPARDRRAHAPRRVPKSQCPAAGSRSRATRPQPD